MKETTKQINFRNRQQPDAQFDLIRIEDLASRSFNDHSPTELHIVKFYILIFMEQGNGYHTIDFTDHSCSKGSLLTVRKDQIHRFHPSGNLSGRMLLFTDEFLISYLEKMEAQKTLLLFNEMLGAPHLQLNETAFKEVQQTIDRIAHEYFSTNDQHSLSIIRSELHILITQLFRIKSHERSFDLEKKYLEEFVRFQRLAEKHVVETTRVQDYAQMMAMSTKTLNTITKSIVHKSAKEFIDEICIIQIKRLLINTELSIKEIADQTGFDESTNFYKYFKRKTLTTPEQFRGSH